ncbi:MAG: preprotein translocase subunit SecE [Desulfurococcaceae archaeon]
MDIGELIESWKKILMLTSKPSVKDYMNSLRLILVGLAIVGVITFLIRVIFYAFLFPQVLS